MGNSGFGHLEYISNGKLRAEADAYRQEICPGGEIPLDIFNIVEFDLPDVKFKTVPHLNTTADTETVLLKDNTILIDKDDFVNPKKETRLKYTLAHELGHIQLHSHLVEDLFPESIDEYVDIIQSTSESQYGRYEYQAYEFAGRLLVPLSLLQEELRHYKGDIDRFLEVYPEGIDDLIQHIAPKLNDRFGVSTDVIEKRLEREDIDFFNI